MDNNEIKKLHTSLYLILPEDVAEDISNRFGELLKTSYLQGAKAQRDVDVEACDESMNQWYNETAEFLRKRPLIKTD